MSNKGSRDGTVFSLLPEMPLLVESNSQIKEAAQLMGKKKSDCVLVVDSDNKNELLGIVTAKDLAFKVVGTSKQGSGYRIEDKISKIMTSNPMCARAQTKARDALNLMVVRRFRHLPIIDENNGIVGVLDITKCYEVAMGRMEELYEESKKLYDAMGSVEGELKDYSKFKIKQPAYIIRYFESLRKLLSGPQLSQVLDDERTTPIYCNLNSTVTEAAVLMKKNKTTAVMVRNEEESVVGILTSKDIVSRVIGNGLNSNDCLVHSVMTENPSSATKELSVSKALRQMFEGKYLNLPVTDSGDNSEIIGIVDVIRLTHFTLSQIQTMESINEENEDEANSPNWLNEALSGESVDYKEVDGVDESDISIDELAQFDVSGFSIDQHTLPSSRSTITGRGPRKMSSMATILPIGYNDKCFIKFRLQGSRVHRLSYVPSDGLDGLMSTIWSELSVDERTELDVESSKGLGLSYHDEDGDMIIIGTDSELKDCVEFMVSRGKNNVEVIVHDREMSVFGKKGKMSSDRARANSLLLPISLFAVASAIIIGVTVTKLKR